MLSVQVKMETNSFKSIESYRYHIHNYSPLAVKSFICEIQKYPIIFSAKNGITLKKELVEFAWTRITVALLDTVVPTQNKVALINLEYWNQSFRQLWKWMVNMYIKEKIETRRNSSRIFIRSLKNQWLDFMSFLDPHLRYCLETSTPSDSDPIQFHSNICLRILPADTKIIHLESGNHILLWLRKFSESPSAKNMCISVCMEIQRCFSPPLPLGLEAMFKQDAHIDESQLVKYTQDPIQQQQQQNQQQKQSRFSSLSFTKTTPTTATTTNINKGTSSKQFLPRAVSFETVIDKDYKYIMSLYPKLKLLEATRKSKVKRLMILALIDSL